MSQAPEGPRDGGGGYVTLSSRHSDPTESATSSDDLDAIERLQDMMAEEVTFVARRSSDGTYGVLVEACEVPSDASLDDPGPDVRPHAEVLADLADEADRVRGAFPGLDVWVEHGIDVVLCRSSVRAFVPEGSDPALAGDVARALLHGPSPSLK